MVGEDVLLLLCCHYFGLLGEVSVLNVVTMCKESLLGLWQSTVWYEDKLFSLRTDYPLGLNLSLVALY